MSASLATGLRASATVLLLRDGPQGLEVLMARRLIQGDHMGGAFIFPGGGLDPADALPQVQAHLQGLQAEAASQAMGLPAVEAAALYLAALREAFEEVGILLGSSEVTPAALAEARRALAARELDWAAWLDEAGVRFHAAGLAYFAHWITPEGFKKRYATRFFLAAVGPDVEALPDEGEVGDAVWVRPVDALAASKAGRMPMVFPTRHALRGLLPHATVAEALAAFQDGPPPPDYLPRPAEVGGQVVMLLPGQSGYDEAPASGLRFDPLTVEGPGW